MGSDGKSSNPNLILEVYVVTAPARAFWATSARVVLVLPKFEYMDSERSKRIKTWAS
jgi:hypothetical protein